jgi:hypothetical protein
MFQATPTLQCATLSVTTVTKANGMYGLKITSLITSFHKVSNKADKALVALGLRSIRLDIQLDRR